MQRCFQNLLRFTTQRINVIVRYGAADRTCFSSLTLGFLLWWHLRLILIDFLQLVFRFLNWIHLQVKRNWRLTILVNIIFRNCSSVMSFASSAVGAYLLYLICVSPLLTCFISLAATESLSAFAEFSSGTANNALLARLFVVRARCPRSVKLYDPPARRIRKAMT